MPAPESILITGGSGMLAQAVLRALQARGKSAVALERAALDVTDEASVQEAFRVHRPALLLNCAAHTKVDLCEEQRELADAINGRAVGILARAAREHGTTLVHYSTDFVFDGSGTRPYRPDDPVRPLSAYGRSKLLGEQQLREHAPDRWLILRTAWLYGQGGPCFPRTMVTLARQGKPLKVVSDQVGCPTLTDDLAAATLDLLDAGATGVWHATNSGQTSWFDFTRAILEEFCADHRPLADHLRRVVQDPPQLRPPAGVQRAGCHAAGTEDRTADAALAGCATAVSGAGRGSRLPVGASVEACHLSLVSCQLRPALGPNGPASDK